MGIETFDKANVGHRVQVPGCMAADAFHDGEPRSVGDVAAVTKLLRPSGKKSPDRWADLHQGKGWCRRGQRRLVDETTTVQGQLLTGANYNHAPFPCSLPSNIHSFGSSADRIKV